MSSPDRRLFLLDAMALIYRAYYALNKNPRVTSKGLKYICNPWFCKHIVRSVEEREPDTYCRCV